MLTTLSGSWQVVSNSQAEFKLYCPQTPGDLLLQPHRKQKKKKIQQKLRPPGFASYLQEVGKDCCMLVIITKRTNEDMVRVRDGSTKYMSTMRFLQSNFGQGNPGMITGDTHGLHPPP